MANYYRKSCLILFLFFVSNAFAQTSTLKGIIKNQCDSLLEYADLRLYNIDSNTSLNSCIKDSSYRFDNIKPGNYYLMATNFFYTQFIQDISIKADRNYIQDIIFLTVDEYQDGYKKITVPFSQSCKWIKVDSSFGDKSKVSGRITSCVNNSPLPDVQIRFYRNNTLKKFVRTDRNGNYSVLLEPGIYDLHLDKVFRHKEKRYGYPTFIITGIQVSKSISLEHRTAYPIVDKWIGFHEVN